MSVTELKLLNVDILKAIRETIDWLVEKYKGITDAQTKSQLGEVANQISTLVTNKTKYLAVLKKSLSSDKEVIDIDEIKKTLEIAESDTENLNKLIVKLDAKKVTYSLKSSLQKLGGLKVVTINELKTAIKNDIVTKSNQETVITRLEKFQQQWDELGNKIQLLIDDKSK